MHLTLSDILLLLVLSVNVKCDFSEDGKICYPQS